MPSRRTDPRLPVRPALPKKALAEKGGGFSFAAWRGGGLPVGPLTGGHVHDGITDPITKSGLVVRGTVPAAPFPEALGTDREANLKAE
jgi:hypothetical protein